MSEVLVLAPYTSTDTLLRRSRWVAHCNAARLQQEGHQTTVREAEQCTIEQIHHDITEKGIAFFGHGQADMIQDSNERPLFGGSAIDSLKDRWFHAFACDAAQDFGQRAIHAGALCFVGYTLSLTPKWDEKNLHPELEERFKNVVSCITGHLASGEYALASLRNELRLNVDELTLWMDDHPEEAQGVRILAQQLLRGLRVLTNPHHTLRR